MQVEVLLGWSGQPHARSCILSDFTDALTSMLMVVQVAMAVSSEGAMMLAFNDASQLGMRTPLTISTSLNQGTTWEEKAVLESNLTASFSYPTLLCPPDSGSCFVIYTVNAHPTMPATRTRQCRCSHVCKAHLRKAGTGYDKEAADLNESCKASPCQEKSR